MMQRLMLGADFLRRKARRHRLDAFALTRQQQPRTIGCKRLPPVCMADGIP